ncbi:MAG: FHA domain-containing protein [Ruminococcus sp.]|nr:FHA domain-containing protein [Ruminococcus sp.]
MSNTVLLQKQNLSPKLFVIYKNKIHDVDFNRPLALGRRTDESKPDLCFDLRFVSRTHGEFSKDDLGYFYVDLGSTNGTYLNGVKLNKNEKAYLKDSDVLHIYSAGFDSDKQFIAIVFATDYFSKWETVAVPLSDSIAEINIGRSGEKNLLVDECTVSANHASFFVANKGWAIIDHSSTNGVFLNNNRLSSPKYLKVGDCVKISNLLFVYLEDKLLYQKRVEDDVIEKEKPEKARVISSNDALDIRIVQRSVWQRTKKLMLLQDINMRVESGEMVLILGGSGAGKTTFMNAVMGYEKAEGKIMHGDTDVYEDFESMKYKIGFVPQQDLLRGSDTTYDTLENAAQMKVPHLKGEKRKERISEVLNELGLTRESQSLVSKLSGGQRKRLSIAVEYIADPSLFFLDEPDSGLDGVMARALMENLRDIANEGKIVMVISHGPDRAADLFDKVIVLAKSVKDNCGHLAYYGTVDGAYRFFDTDTLEGVVRRINREDEGGDGKSDFYIEKYSKLIHSEV